MHTSSEQLFLITYSQDGLVRRDSQFDEHGPALAHFQELQRRFPEAQVQLHSYPVTIRPEPVGPSPWLFLEL
ncbi:MAG: hypothetical protein ACO1RX_01200 [Candidatus Sericytochromatia bacterium]